MENPRLFILVALLLVGAARADDFTALTVTQEHEYGSYKPPKNNFEFEESIAQSYETEAASYQQNYIPKFQKIQAMTDPSQKSGALSNELKSYHLLFERTADMGDSDSGAFVSGVGGKVKRLTAALDAFRAAAPKFTPAERKAGSAALYQITGSLLSSFEGKVKNAKTMASQYHHSAAAVKTTQGAPFSPTKAIVAATDTGRMGARGLASTANDVFQAARYYPSLLVVEQLGKKK